MASPRQERIATQTPSEADFGSPSERGITFRSVSLGPEVLAHPQFNARSRTNPASVARSHLDWLEVMAAAEQAS